MDRKTLIFLGAGVLALGGVLGYGASLFGRFDDSLERGGAWRDGYGMNRMDDRGGRLDDSRGTGMMNRDGSGLGRGNGQGMMGGGQGLGLGSGSGGRGECYSDGCLGVDDLEYPVGTLSDAAKNAVLSALDDEYKAKATYDAVIEKFGSKRPFIMVIRAEEQHIAALKSILDKYGVTIPADPWSGKVTAPETLQASCQAGVDAETANAALYRDKLLPSVKEYTDITSVFQNLMNASQSRHLPAFERCN